MNLIFAVMALRENGLHDIADKLEQRTEAQWKKCDPAGVHRSTKPIPCTEWMRGAFSWHASPEGWEYWSGVHAKLKEKGL